MAYSLISPAFSLTLIVQITSCQLSLHYSFRGIHSALQLDRKRCKMGQSCFCFGYKVYRLRFLQCTSYDFHFYLKTHSHDMKKMLSSCQNFDLFSLGGGLTCTALSYLGIWASLVLFALLYISKNSPHVCSCNCYHPSSSTRVYSLSTAFCPNMLRAAVNVCAVQ